MNDYKITDYSIFSNAISTTNKLKESVNTFKSGTANVKSVVGNNAVFMGPAADKCVQEITNLDTIATTLLDTLGTINTYLSQTSSSYQSGDSSASQIVLSTTTDTSSSTSTTTTSSNTATASAYNNPGKLSGYRLDFINEIKDGAISTYKKYGVLPSLTMAQAILESGWGTSPIGKNLFGMKAGKSWKGKTKTTKTSEQRKDGSTYSINAKFRDYDSYAESIEDHGKLLTNDRYKPVIASKDYKEACKAVKDCGYATSLTYTKKLINIIESYGLNQWDPK